MFIKGGMELNGVLHSHYREQEVSMSSLEQCSIYTAKKKNIGIVDNIWGWGLAAGA